ncbi:MAG TPA: tetratricopeptide repeat protein [Pyrinomonadaceae bacterium]|nr:tetratricopeptide repeat protein [Pyrinomonadaceae bacterium]
MRYRECQIFSFRFIPHSILLCLSIFFVACGHSTASFLAKGEEYLQKRKFHDAMMQFRSAAESDGGSAAAHWGLARSYENLGQFNDVLDELRKTIELDGTNLEAKAKLGSYFLLVQPPMISETEKLRDEILAADPKFIEGHILTATIMAAQGKPDADVIAQVNKAIDLNPQRIESYISLERLYMTREKLPEAEAVIQRGIAANPASIAGLTEYGRFLMYGARNAEAEAQFQKAIAIDGTSIDAHESIAQFYVTSRQFEKAEAAYKNLVQVQENSPESRLELAEFYSTTERKDEAIAVLEQIIADAPDYVLARYRVGQMYLDRKETVKVYEQLDALLKINDADIQALMLRSRAKMQDSKPDEAVKDIEDVLKQQPSNRDALYLMAQARLALGQNDQANAFIGDIERFHPTFMKVGLLKIQAAFSAGDAQNALKLSNELIDKTSSAQPNADNTPQIILDLRIKGISSRGLAYLDLGKLAEAKYDLRDVVRLTPRSSGAMVNLAKVFIAERNAAAALDLYEKAYAADAKNFDAISGIVTMAIQMGQTEKAHTRIASFIDANAGKGDVIAALRYLNATVFTAEKNNPAAEKELLAAIELDADYLPAYSAYASLLTSQNRTDEALAQYKKVIEKKPAAQVYTMIGILEDGRGNTAEAEANYRKALDIAPDSAIAANNLAWLLADHSGNLDEALQLASGAVARNQNVAEYYDTLGWVYLKKGLTSPAVEQMKKAVALDESNAKKTGTAPKADYRNRLAQAMAKAGGKPAASV